MVGEVLDDLAKIRLGIEPVELPRRAATRIGPIAPAPRMTETRGRLEIRR
jgi:hypothetical protein